MGPALNPPHDCLIAYYKTLAPDSLSGSELDRYLAIGWYRMHQTIFTTTHLLADECYRVHWLRFPILEIGDRASHRRIRKRNESFKVTLERFTQIRSDHEELYSRYRGSIDFSGALSIQQSLFGENSADKNIYVTQCISVFDEDTLIAGGYFDLGDNSAAAILHFSDPTYMRCSLGKYLMLLTLDFLNANGYEFYYPGYVIAGNPKMDYKLFIGKEATQYFDPETEAWSCFQDSILHAEEYTLGEKLKVIRALVD